LPKVLISVLAAIKRSGPFSGSALLNLVFKASVTQEAYLARLL
jgi:hypothetical protein